MTNLTGTFWRASQRIAAFLHKAVAISFSLLVMILLLLAMAWYFLPAWGPSLAERWLPNGVSLVLDGRPVWRQGALRVPDFVLNRGQCAWIAGSAVSVRRQAGSWQIGAERVQVDSGCAVAGGDRDRPLTWSDLETALPPMDVHIEQLALAAWPEYSGSLDIRTRAGVAQVRFHNARLSLAAQLRERQLTLDQFTLTSPRLTDPHAQDVALWQITLRGQITLSAPVAAAPERGALTVDVILPGDAPLAAVLDWRQTQGVLSVTDPRSAMILAQLPWRIDQGQLRIMDGEWRWPYATQPLSGRVTAVLGPRQDAVNGIDITARMNMLTQGLRGKANAVLSLGPGSLGLTDNALAFHFTGLANMGDLSLDASIPGQLRGPLIDPTLALLPGALLRVVGPVSRALNINSARLPLAGIRVSSQGLNGRLQAILQADATNYGRFNLHMDGRATDFLPDRGQWRWRYWGGGYVAPFLARWDINGRGSWLAQTIELSELSSGFNQLNYGLVKAATPRVSLLAPLRWRRDASQPALSGALRLDASRIDITRGGYVPRPALTLTLKGTDPQNFLLQGELRAGEPTPGAVAIGPVRLNGRWDGTRLRGQAWWPRQPLRVFQTLLEPSLKITLREGEFTAQSAFSAAAGQGFLAGGHATVRRGDIWIGENRLRGIGLDLSYRLREQRWLLGVKQPIALHIDRVETPVMLTNLAVGVRGYYPYDDHWPLTLTGMNMETLGGSVYLTPLRLPQRDAALLKVKSIEMSQLITALKPKQFAVSGRVSGELPLQLEDPRGYIRRGWIASDSVMALRLDEQFANAIASRNLATGAAINWLRYMEITRLRAELNVDRAGEMDMLAHIIGTNPRINAQREVRFNYRQQQNIFQLWRSLRFGANVEQTLEKQGTMPTNRPVQQVRGN